VGRLCPGQTGQRFEEILRHYYQGAVVSAYPAGSRNSPGQAAGRSGSFAWHGPPIPLPPGQSLSVAALPLHGPALLVGRVQVASDAPVLARAGGDLAGRRLWKQIPGPHPRLAHRPHQWSRSTTRALGAQTGCLASATTRQTCGGDGAKLSTLDEIRGARCPAIPARSPATMGSNSVIHSGLGQATTCGLPRWTGGRFRARRRGHYGQALADAGGLQPSNLLDSGSMATWASTNPPAWPSASLSLPGTQREPTREQNSADSAAIQWPGPAWPITWPCPRSFRPSASSWCQRWRQRPGSCAVLLQTRPIQPCRPVGSRAIRR